MLTLQAPSEELRAAFIEMAGEFDAHGDARYVRDANDFVGYLARVRDKELGRGLSSGQVPDSHFWLVRDGDIIGCSRLRHRLTPELEHEGGHIGYDVRPSERRRGFGTILLRLTLERATARGLVRVRITCDAENLGSIRVIENNGGVLDGEVLSRARGKPIRQYWVTVPGGATEPAAERQ